MTGRESLRKAQDAGGPAEDVLGEGSIGLLAGHAAAVLALRGLALQASTAAAATLPGTAHDELAHRPLRDLVSDGGDRAAPFVPGDGARCEAPTVAQLVDVGPADAAGMDADDDLVRTRLGHLALLDSEDAW